jgi:hypothetical protein
MVEDQPRYIHFHCSLICHNPQTGSRLIPDVAGVVGFADIEWYNNIPYLCLFDDKLPPRHLLFYHGRASIYVRLLSHCPHAMYSPSLSFLKSKKITTTSLALKTRLKESVYFMVPRATKTLTQTDDREDCK